MRQCEKTRRKNLRQKHSTSEACLPIVRRLAFSLYSHEKGVMRIFKDAGVAHCLINQWTSGIRNPTLRTFCKILDVMGMELVIQFKKDRS
jgi:transcriptional regulator with XRE-family HTH domain